MADTAALGIMAFNEERNIGRTLESVLAFSRSDQITRIVVVASGCTDRTCEIARRFSELDPRVEVVEEPSRAGKVAAINSFLLSASEEILMVSGADLIFEPQTVEELLRPFEDPEVGMVGAHPVPLDSRDDFFSFATRLMWTLHHEISMSEPKMGELIAFRNVFRRLNPAAICDELSVHQLVRSAGYTSVYASQAVVRNKGPETLSDFVSQRMHCIVGNLQIMRDHHIPVSTMRTLPVLRAALPHVVRNWRRLHWVAGTAVLELYCRAKSRAIYRSKAKRQRFQIWDQATTTKMLSEEPQALSVQPPAAKIAR